MQVCCSILLPFAIGTCNTKCFNIFLMALSTLWNRAHFISIKWCWIAKSIILFSFTEGVNCAHASFILLRLQMYIKHCRLCSKCYLYVTNTSAISSHIFLVPHAINVLVPELPCWIDFFNDDFYSFLLVFPVMIISLLSSTAFEVEYSIIYWEYFPWM